MVEGPAPADMHGGRTRDQIFGRTNRAGGYFLSMIGIAITGRYRSSSGWSADVRGIRAYAMSLCCVPVRSPRRLFLAALSALGLLTRVASQCANMKKDPHLAFARGGRADFRGRNGAYYAFLSTPGLQINVRTEEAQFKTFRDALTVDGSFITEVHAVALVGGEKHKLATASFWTDELNEFTTGPNMINGPLFPRTLIRDNAPHPFSVKMCVKKETGRGAPTTR